MNPLDSLAPLAGAWHGVNTLHDPNTGKPDESPSALTVTPILAGRFVRLDYTWVYQNKPQEGSLLIGFDSKTAVVSAHWIDSWHMGNAALACSGKAGGATISVRGAYPAPPGPDWGWRIDLMLSADRLQMAMFNIWPADQGGAEEPAVEAVYGRG